MTSDDLGRDWQRVTARLARLVNTGWWLQVWLPMMLAISVAGGLAMLGLRMARINPQPWAWQALSVAALLLALAAWWRSRARFETIEAARVRLEDALGLKTRLTSAASGVGPWPALPEKAFPMPVNWRWQRPLMLLAFCAALLAIGAWMPVPEQDKPKAHVIEKPAAVKQVEQWVEDLRRDKAADPESLDAVEKKIEELLRRPNEQWYEHASLEAAEHLRDETGKDLQELGTQLEQSRGSLETMAEMSEQLGEEARSGLSKQLSDNLNGLRSGAMQANSDLAQQLKDLDPKSLNGLSKEQMKQLADRLKQNADALRKALASAPQFDFKECRCKGDKPGEGEGEGDKPGKGGVSRGKGDAKLTLKDKETDLNATNKDNASTMIDPARIAPGDLLGLQNGKPTADPKDYQGTQAGGGLQSTGQGGAAVEQATLVPSERAVLKRFFK